MLGLALVMRLCPQIPFSRLLNERLIEQPVAWFATDQATNFIYFIIVAVMFLTSGELIALLARADLFFASANLALHVGAIVATSVVAAVSCGKVTLQTRRAKLSFWRIQALGVSNSTFGKCARRRRGDFSSADNDDDPATVFVIAA